MADHRFFMSYMDIQDQDTPIFLSRVFARMEEDKTVESTFYDGTVRTAHDFVADLTRPGTLPFLVLWEGLPAGVTWLNSIEGRAVRGHFCLFRQVWGRKRTVPIGRGIFETLLTLRDGRGFFFDVVLGLTPADNPFSWRLALACGARKVGVIPNGIYLAATGSSADAVLTATTRESLGLE